MCVCVCVCVCVEETNKNTKRFVVRLDRDNSNNPPSKSGPSFTHPHVEGKLKFKFRALLLTFDCWICLYCLCRIFNISLSGFSSLSLVLNIYSPVCNYVFEISLLPCSLLRFPFSQFPNTFLHIFPLFFLLFFFLPNAQTQLHTNAHFLTH